MLNAEGSAAAVAVNETDRLVVSIVAETTWAEPDTEPVV
jgi:hypothetical protein